MKQIYLTVIQRISVCMIFLLMVQSAIAQSRTISGKITDARNGEAISGATIVVNGTNLGTARHCSGWYILN